MCMNVYIVFFYSIIHVVYMLHLFCYILLFSFIVAFKNVTVALENFETVVFFLNLG